MSYVHEIVKQINKNEGTKNHARLQIYFLLLGSNYTSLFKKCLNVNDGGLMLTTRCFTGENFIYLPGNRIVRIVYMQRGMRGRFHCLGPRGFSLRHGNECSDLITISWVPHFH